jgi:hypothetical protein
LSFTVVAGAVAEIVLTGATTDLPSGTARTLTATLRDAAGNTVTSGPHSTLSVTFAQTAGDGAVTGLGSVSAVAGVATLDVTGSAAGSVTIRATTTSPDLTSNTLTFTVVAEDALRLAFLPPTPVGPPQVPGLSQARSR